jgi:hypothetical protein
VENVVVENIYDFTEGQESGIVVYPNGETIICNWSDQSLKGLPRVLSFGKLIGLGEKIKLIKTQKMTWEDIEKWAETDIKIIYDYNDDAWILPDTYGIGYEIEAGGTTALVYAPDGWC